MKKIKVKIKLTDEQLDKIFEDTLRDTIESNITQIEELKEKESLKQYQICDLEMSQKYLKAARVVWDYHSIEPFPDDDF